MGTQVQEEKPVIDVTEKYSGSDRTEKTHLDNAVINPSIANQKMLKMQKLTDKYNAVVRKMKSEDLSSMGLKEKMMFYLKKNEPVDLQDLFGSRIEKLREFADSLDESVKECTANKTDIFKNMQATGEQLTGYKNEFTEMDKDVAVMGKELDALATKGIVAEGFGTENLRMYKLEDAIEVATRDAQIVDRLIDGTQGYFHFYDFHNKLYTEMVQLGKQAVRDVELHTGKMEQLVKYIENPQKVVENFLQTYHQLQSTNNFLTQMYNCLIGYTKLIHNVGLPGIVDPKTYNNMKASTDEITQRSEQFRHNYKDTMANLRNKIQSEKTEILEKIK